MAQSFQATPTLQANIAGTSTTVNQRDWLNTRISPFLKKAIIESLDSEAEYPLQWLGEHLIQQSILFEGNPDSTKIQERFRYKHDAKLPATLAQSATPSHPVPSSASQQATTPQTAPAANTASSVPTDAPAVSTHVESAATTSPNPNAMAESSTTAPTVNVNGSIENPGEGPGQDTEMSNAP